MKCLHYTAESVFAPPRLVRGFTEKNYSKDYHTQGFYEVNIVLRGGAVHCIGERSMQVSQGDTFIIPPDVPHSYDGGEGFDVYHILISPAFLEKNSAELQMLPAFQMLFKIDPMMREKTAAKLHFKLNTEELSELSVLLEKLTEYTLKGGASGAIMTNCQALTAIAWLCEAYSERFLTEDEQGEDEGFQRSIAYIYENITRRISINELLSIARMSRTSYIVKFKRVTGSTPGRFHMINRVELAKNMLRETSEPISQIAMQVGYYDSSHFVRCFMEITGVTPSEYRTENRLM